MKYLYHYSGFWQPASDGSQRYVSGILSQDEKISFKDGEYLKIQKCIGDHHGVPDGKYLAITSLSFLHEVES